MSFDLAPLPSGYRRVSRHAWLVDDAGVRTVCVRSVTVAQYDLSDRTGRNVAMVLLDAGGYAKQKEIAVAFGLTSRQVNRLCTRVAREGWASLARKERADKTPPSVAARVCALRHDGLKVAAIAEQVGLSPRTVYGVLVDRGLDPHDRHGAVQACLAVDEGGADDAEAPVEMEAVAARSGVQAPRLEADVQQRIAAQSQHVRDLLQRRSQLPRRCMLSESNRADEVKLSVERKLCSDLIEVAAYRAERQLVRRIEGAFARNADEGHAFIRTAMQQTGQIRVEGTDVHVTLEPMSAPRFTRALQALCDAINSDCPTYPETDWRLHFEVRKDEDRHPGTTACREF